MPQNRTNRNKRQLGSDKNEAEAVAQKRVKIVEESSSSPLKEASLSPSHQAVSNGWEDESDEWPPPIQYSEAESEAEDLTVKEDERNERNTKETHDEEEKKEIKAAREEEERKEINIEKPQKEGDQLSCNGKQPKRKRRGRRAGFLSRMEFLGINCTKQGKAALASQSDVLKSIKPDPNAAVPIKPKIHDETASLWSNILKSGQPADNRANLLKLYPGLANCNVAPPKLNPEVVVQLDQRQVTRDACLCSKQELAGASLTALGQAIDMLTSTPKEVWNKEQLVKWLGDAARLTASLHYEESITRRTIVYPLFPEEFRAVCETSKSDDFLFGENLGQRARSFKRKVNCSKPPPKSSHGMHQPRQNQKQSRQELSRRSRRRTKGRFHFEIPRSSSRETDQKEQGSSRNSK